MTTGVFLLSTSLLIHRKCVSILASGFPLSSPPHSLSHTQKISYQWFPSGLAGGAFYDGSWGPGDWRKKACRKYTCGCWSLTGALGDDGSRLVSDPILVTQTWRGKHAGSIGKEGYRSCHVSVKRQNAHQRWPNTSCTRTIIFFSPRMHI